MALKSIEDEWLGFSAMIFRGATPAPNQVAEMRKAFFAGAWAMLCGMREIGEDHISEQQGVDYFEARQQEGEQFYKSLMREYVERN